MPRRAYGWTADDSAVVPNEAAELIAAARAIDAGKPRKQIVRELNDRGIATSEGNEWTITVLSRMLAKPRMIGRKADALGRPIMRGEYEYPPILKTDEEIELWKRVRAIINNPRRKKRSQHPPALMHERLVCGVCGAGMYPTRPKNKPPRYHCHQTSGCGRMSQLMSVVDEYVAHELVDRAAARIPGASEVSVAAWWSAATLEQRQELIAGFIDQVSVHPLVPGYGGTARIQIAWSDMPAWPAGLVSAA